MKRRFRELGILLFLLLLMVGTAIANPRFLQLSNLSNILLDLPMLLVIACGMTPVIISRNIDLSVGSMLGLSAMVVGMLLRAHPNLPLPIAFATGIGVGCVLGALNGVLIAFLKIPAIIATLATLNIYRGTVFLICEGRQIDPNDIPAGLTRLAQTSFLGISPLAIIAATVALLAYYLLRCRRVGRDVYAIGGNGQAAELRGIPIRRTTFALFVLLGAVSGLAGVMYAARYGTVNPAQAGVGYELSVIAATVIGGADVFGGSGTIGGALLGCLLLTTLANALAITGLSGAWQLAAYGLIILAAVVTDALLRRRMEAA